jgi:hypothetical protein
MTDAEVKEILRSNGMCGRVSDGFACLLERHHDDNVHERGWTVKRDTVRSPYKRDEREADDVVFHVQESAPTCGHPAKCFTTYNQAHAEWLASTLTKLDL